MHETAEFLYQKDGGILRRLVLSAHMHCWMQCLFATTLCCGLDVDLLIVESDRIELLLRVLPIRIRSVRTRSFQFADTHLSLYLIARTILCRI